jgi:copper chaperone CopZ
MLWFFDPPKFTNQFWDRHKIKQGLQMIKKVFRITDMHCSNCAIRIESLEDELDGVKTIAASYQKGQMVVEYDETKVSDEAIIAAVQKKGYTATTS